MINSQKGSTTVEGVIVISTVIMCVIAIIYIIILIYQFTYIQSSVQNAAVMGATTLASGGNDVKTGNVTKDEIDKRGLYRRLYNLDINQKSGQIETYLKGKLNPYNVLKTNFLDFKTSNKNYVIFNELTVGIDRSHIIPAGGMLRGFGLSDKMSFGASVKTTVNDPAEFIRNTDFLIHTAAEIDEKTDGKLSAKIDKVKASFDKISSIFK